VTVTVTVTNRGEGKATSFYIAYFIDDVVLKPSSISGLGHGASVNRTCTWTAEPGRHTFRAVADAYSHVAESNEDDNEYTVAVAANMPDLAVGTVTWSPADLPAGKEVTFSIDIDNLGTMSAAPSRVAYYVDGQVVGYTDIGRLEAGSAATAEFPWVVAEGAHSIKIVADASDHVFEIDETNNNRLVNLPPPDLIVTDITWVPSSAAKGDTVTFTATLKNQGSGRSTGAEASCYVDGERLATRDLPEIEPGGAVASIFEWEAEAGVHTIRVVADDAGRVVESDETNNEREAGFATLTPDLCFEETGWLMENPLIDDEVTFHIVIKNRGTGPAAVSRLKYTIDNSPPAYEDVGALKAGEKAAVSFLAGLEAGPHSVTVTVDVDNAVDEMDEDNNEEVLDFSTIVPDLVIKSITWEPLDAAPGDVVTVTVRLENRGRETAVKPRLALLLDGSEEGCAEIPELEVGGVASLDFIWTALPGLHEIGALADADGLVPESDETNNTRSRALEVASPAAPETSLAGPATGSAGDKGFLGNFWWIVLLVAAMLGISAFVLAMRSFKKE
jgi:subtilase family serine protease